MTQKEINHIKYRVRELPDQLDRARRRYTHLIREAKRLGMRHLLEDREHEAVL
jgi:hypothetical protein